MKTLKSYWVGVIAAAGILLCGCGGAGMSDNDGRGEGNIPIGRVSAPSGNVNVTGNSPSTSAVTGTVDSQGVVWLQRMPVGEAWLMLSSNLPGYELVYFKVNFAAQQQNVIDVNINVRRLYASVSSIAIDIDSGPELIAGNTYTLLVAATGTNIYNMKPTLWVDGGLGYFDANHRFVATTPGTGALRAQLLGVSTSLPITVR